MDDEREGPGHKGAKAERQRNWAFVQRQWGTLKRSDTIKFTFNSDWVSILKPPDRQLFISLQRGVQASSVSQNKFNYHTADLH